MLSICCLKAAVFNAFDDKSARGLGIEFYKAKTINVLMLKGAAMNSECRVIKTMKLGDHMMFVGEVTEASATKNQPLVYSDGKYWSFGSRIQKPDQKMLERIKNLFEKYKK